MINQWLRPDGPTTTPTTEFPMPRMPKKEPEARARMDERRSAEAARFGPAMRTLSRSTGPTFEVAEDGQKVRVWGNPYEDYVTDADVRQWLLGRRVVELREGLEFVRESYLHAMIKKGWLRKDAAGPFYWITEAAAEKFQLLRVLGCKFPETVGHPYRGRAVQTLTSIPLDRMFPNPDQPRKKFEPTALVELAASIRSNGLLQPITVRPVEGKLEIVAGERRWRAHCLLAEQGELPGGVILAHVREMDVQQRDIEAIVENLSRADITPMEEARAFKRVLDTGMTEDELARKLGIQLVWRIRDRVRLLNLAPEFIKMFEGGYLSAEAVYEISRLERHADQTKIVQMIVRGQISGYKAVKAAVAAIIEGLAQQDIFGDTGPRVTEDEVSTVNRMEAKVERVAEMVAAGWKDGECVIARKVSPDRARVMADRIKAIRSHLLQMENQLREAAAQGDLINAA